MRVLSIASAAAVALVASGLGSDAEAQLRSSRPTSRVHGVERARELDPQRVRGIERAREVANPRAAILRGDVRGRDGSVWDDGDSDSDSDSDSDGRGKYKNKGKNKHKNKNRDRGDVVFDQRGASLPSGICRDINRDGMCDSRTSRRGATARDVILRRRTNDGILRRRMPGNIIAQQLGLQLLQRAAQQYSYRQR